MKATQIPTMGTTKRMSTNASLGLTRFPNSSLCVSRGIGGIVEKVGGGGFMNDIWLVDSEERDQDLEFVSLLDDTMFSKERQMFGLSILEAVCGLPLAFV